MHKPATQSPATFPLRSAYKAVDGDTSNDVYGNMCTDTGWGTPSNPAWWRVDLEAYYNLTGIKIYNRNKDG